MGRWFIRTMQDRPAMMVAESRQSSHRGYPPAPLATWYEYSSEEDVLLAAEAYSQQGIRSENIEVLHISDRGIRQLRPRRISVVLEEVSTM